MARPLSAVHIVGDSAGHRAKAASAAARRFDVGVVILHSTDIRAAAAAAVEGPEVVVLIDPTPDDFKIAFATLDPRGLPRWAVVPRSPEAWEGQVASADEWSPVVLERSIGFAVSLLALRRDNARLSGDLYTVARRLAHDLRTPLNSISTANEALAGVAVAAEPAPTLHRAISVAVGETGGLIERVAAVLVAGARPMVTQSVDMEEIVWNAREKLDARLRFAGATIVSPAKWPVVQGVPSWLEHVWVDLLSNSVDHGGPTPRIEVGWTRATARACFWVRDSGPGVPLAKRAHLFHPFDRLNEFSAPRGYGLSLVHRLIELQGGTSGYALDPAPGGTFYFSLPEHE